MKKTILAMLLFSLFACEKKSDTSATRPYGDRMSPMVIVAEKVFQDSILNRGTPVGYRASTPRTPIWNEGEPGTYEGMAAVYVPVVYQDPMLMKASIAGSFYFHLNYLTDLVIYKDSLSHFQSRVLTFFPDSTFFKDPTKSFSGIEFVEDWNGNGISKLLYSGGQIRRYVPSTKQVDLMDIIETCYTISGYNYSEDDPDDGYSWSEDGGCSVSYIDEGSGGGGGGSSGSTGGGGEGGGASGRRVYMLGGGPANGKSSLIKSGFLPHPENALKIDVDEIKLMLPEYQYMLTKRESLAAPIVHVESANIGHDLRSYALESGYDIVWDGIANESLEHRMEAALELKSYGHHCRVDYVTLDMALSLELAELRYQRTGRRVPESVIKEKNRSVAELVPQLIKHQVFDELYLWDTNIHNQPRLILSQKNGKLEVADQALYNNFKMKAHVKAITQTQEQGNKNRKRSYRL